MPFITVPNVLMAELVFSGASGVCENTLYFRKDTSVQDSDPEDIAIMLTAWWKENLQVLVSNGLTLIKIKVVDLSTEDGFFTEMPVIDGVGGNISAKCPMNVTAAIKFNTNRSGRSYRGRNYFAGLTTTQVTGDALVAGVRDSLIAAYQDLMDHAGNIGFTWVVVSRYMNNAPRATGISTQVEAVTMDSTLDSQRRRLYGRGG